MGVSKQLKTISAIWYDTEIKTSFAGFAAGRSTDLIISERKAILPHTMSIQIKNADLDPRADTRDRLIQI